ncbi:MAG: UDP-glucose 4-epimerase GalE [Deltaproteobacteria bacterium]|nr:UDP-glucose 4-epimerase GalE [Deltaproteobacteria bacterium]MBN2670721.1 UDP-glucose 4-epimerase GalE [Deltaproteobacteria bacterium]
MTAQKKRTVLVTGGAGYIGSHVCKELHHQGYTPVTYDNMSKGHQWAVKWGPLVEGDLHDSKTLQQAFDTYQPIAVMHFAASIEVGESVEAPIKYYRNNVGGSLNLLQIMLENNCKQIVFSSTAATYGAPQTELIDETHPQNPINPYGASKLMVERIIRDCCLSDQLRFVFLRYFNACGADSDVEIGESHTPETHLIPIVMQAAAGDREKLYIFGDDYHTPDGTCLRDYIHVEDLAAAHILALESLLSGATSNEFNLGTGQGYSVREIIQAAEKVVGHAIPYEVHAKRAGDPPVLVASSKKAEQQLNWSPQKNLTEILTSAWRWYQKQT